MSEMDKLAAALSQKQAEEDQAKEAAKEQYGIWVSSLNGLMKQLELWLKPLSTTGVVTVTRGTKPMSESPTPSLAGRYDAPTLLIETGTKRINVEPIGRYVLGSHGAVTVKGVSKTITFARHVEDDAESWVISNKPACGSSITSQELSEDNFARVLQDFFK